MNQRNQRIHAQRTVLVLAAVFWCACGTRVEDGTAGVGKSSEKPSVKVEKPPAPAERSVAPAPSAPIAAVARQPVAVEKEEPQSGPPPATEKRQSADWVPPGCHRIEDVNREGFEAALCHTGFARTERELPDGSTAAVVVEGESRILMGPQRTGSPDVARAVGDDREVLKFTYEGFLRFCSTSRGFCHRVGQALGVPGGAPRQISAFILHATIVDDHLARVRKVDVRLTDGTLLDLDSLSPGLP